MARAKLGDLLFDLPSDHEIEGALATECETIKALIHNKGLHARVKRICVASSERFKGYPNYRLQVQFVHLSCHGQKNGIGLLNGMVKWSDVAKQIVKHLRPLNDDQQRVICFSCCYSRNGFEATKARLKTYFTGAYYFRDEKIPFSTSITTWAMFYLKKKLKRPHEAIVKSINDFMGKDVIVFKKY